MTRPTVSAVIPTYNRSESLAAAIRSVLEQSRPCDEVIVVDHGSTDQTSDVLSAFDREVTAVRLSQDLLDRPAVSRNAGLRKATGDLICFLDDDDLWERDKVQIQLEALGQDSQVGLTCSDAHRVEADGRLVAGKYLAHTKGHSGWVLKELLRDNFVITSSVMARAELLRAVGGFNERLDLRGFEDYELWLRTASAVKFAFIAQPLVRYRLHETRLSNEMRADSFRGRRSAMRRALTFRRAQAHLPQFAIALLREGAREFITRRRQAP